MLRRGFGRCMLGICRLGIVDSCGGGAGCGLLNGMLVRENLGLEVVLG